MIKYLVKLTRLMGLHWNLSNRILMNMEGILLRIYLIKFLIPAIIQAIKVFLKKHKIFQKVLMKMK